MRQRLVRLTLLGGAALALAAGCSGGGKRLQFTSRADDIKASLRLPPGWAAEGRPGEYFVLFSQTDNAENRGSITVYPAEGMDLGQWVDSVLAGSRSMEQAGKAMGRALEHLAGGRAGEAARKPFSHKEISRTPRKVGRYQAIELVEESGGKQVITLAVKKGDRVCAVMFASVAEQWADNEPRFRRSLDTLRVR